MGTLFRRGTAYQSQLKNRALQVLLYLIDRSNKEYTCFPAVPTISRELHISISTVKRAMRELVEAGYVAKESRFRKGNGGQTSNLYTLYFPEVEGKSDKESVQGEVIQDEAGQTTHGERTENMSNVSENEQGLPEQVKYYFNRIIGILCPKDSRISACAFRWPGEGFNLIPP